MAKFWTSNLKSETGVVLGLNENNYPYKINNIFEDFDPLTIRERVEKWLEPKKMSYI